MFQFFKNLYYNIRRIIIWFPVIWNDRNWDYDYLFEILKFKIKQIRYRTEKLKMFDSWEHKVKYMKLCEKLLDLIMNETKEFPEPKTLEDLKYEVEYYNRCQTLLFKILNTHVCRWWD